MTEYREGDLVRITDKATGEGYQVRLRTCPIKNHARYTDQTLFAPRDATKNWEKWTFFDWYLKAGKDQYTVELIERAKTYTKDEVMKLARKAAYGMDPSYAYGGDLNKLIVKLEESL